MCAAHLDLLLYILLEHGLRMAPTILRKCLVGAGCLCHGEEGVRNIRKEGVQVEVLPTPWLLFLIPKQHGHHVAEELVAPFLCWPPDILILCEMEQRSQGGTSLGVGSMPGSPAALPGSSHDLHSFYHSKASHLAHWCFQKGESAIPSAWHPIPLGSSHPGAFIRPSPKLPSTGVHIASPFSPLPTLPQQTHPLWTGELSLPSGLSELEGEDSLCHPSARAGTVQGRARGRAEGGSAQEGVPGGLSVAAMSSHLPLQCLGLSSCHNTGTSGVWQCEAASTRPACVNPGLYQSEANGLGRRLDHAPPCVVGSQGRGASMPESGHPEHPRATRPAWQHVVLE